VTRGARFYSRIPTHIMKTDTSAAKPAPREPVCKSPWWRLPIGFGECLRFISAQELPGAPASGQDWLCA
jgi:hypothetical protein